MAAPDGRSPEDRAALAVNAAAYDRRDERTFLHNTPHLRHASVSAVHRALIEQALEWIGRPGREVTVLELGAGDGNGTMPWFERGARVTAVDASARMLERLQDRAGRLGVPVETHVGDAAEVARALGRRFDVVSCVSMLHHVPDYLGLLESGLDAVDVGGCLLTFQDPLRFDRLPRGVHALDRAAYFAWRIFQGNLRQGLRTRLRRLRGVYLPAEPADYQEYHVVRNGVDSEAILRLLCGRFASVREVRYWSTQGSLQQWAGDRLGLRTSFGVLAAGRQA